jgi:3'(2'), 5'-bisphosphate nucleotidase
MMGAPPNRRVSPSAADRQAAARLLAPLTDLVARAGQAILAIDRTAMSVGGKRDGSPVTDADLASDRIMAEGLAVIAPRVPVVSEERASAGLSSSTSFFLVDPLDGTKEFIAGRDEFTVNLAMVAHGTPILGLIGAPALGLIWRGIVGQGAERLSTGKAGRTSPIHTRPFPTSGQPWVAAVSRSHFDASTEAFIDARRGAVRQPLGSAVKFAHIAEGRADIYPRLAPTHEWDVAAGCALVTAAGGKMTDPRGGELRFGQAEKSFVVPAFIAWGDPNAAP